MIYLKTLEEIELIREAAQLVSKTLGYLAPFVKAGSTGKQLDKLAEEYIRDHGGDPAFKGYHGYPASLCVSVNEVVVHGIPNNEPFKEGDIVSIDCGVKKNGFYGDHAFTFLIEPVAPEVKKLVQVTYECLMLGIEQASVGNRIGDIGYAIQQHAEQNGFGVVRDLVGHGLGKNLHEEPEVPNFGRPGNGHLLKNGMVLAIEPMINLGKYKVQQLKDGWTIVTADKKPSAHFEHDIAIINGKAEILSTFEFIYQAIGKPDFIR
ncbi:MAG: methionine aminopeptidase [Bacteroidia bacterium]|nr:MAG: methionine aminopeptidase [Bacteroidia bacterium]